MSSCAADEMDTIRDEVSVLLQKLLDRLTSLEHYEESLADIQPVSSVDQLTQVMLYPLVSRLVVKRSGGVGITLRVPIYLFFVFHVVFY